MLLGTKHTLETRQKIALKRYKTDEQRAIRIRNGYRYLPMRDHPNADCDGYVGEHVYVMSQYLGRPLEKGEHTHHRNKDRLDNRIENLLLHTASTHMAEHRQEYVQSIIGRTCGLCGSDKTTINKKKERKTGKYYEHPDWRHLSIHGDMWLCKHCYNIEKYHKVKKW